MNIIPNTGTYQGVGLSGELINVANNTNFNFTIYYDNTNDDTTLDTVGYNLYFDSSQIEFLDYGNYSEDFKTDYIQTQYNLYIGLGDATANMIANMNWTNNYSDDNQIYGTDLKEPNNSNFDAINSFSKIF